MVDIQAIFNEAGNIQRQDSVCVDGVDYKINTHFTPWLIFSREYAEYKSGKKPDIKIFDFIYKTGRDNEGERIGNVPPNRENGLKELKKFYDEPFDEKHGNKRIIDCVGSNIFDACKKTLGIDLNMDDIHFHKFVKIILILVEKGIIEDNSLWAVVD